MAAKKKGKAGGPFEALRALEKQLRENEKQSPAKKPLPPPPPKRKAPEGPEDEALLFHRLFAGVEPLDRSRGSRLPKQTVDRSAAAERATRARQSAQDESDAVHERLRALVEGAARFEVSDDGRRVEGRRVDLPLESLRRLRRGLLPIDARLDLHGMVQDDARRQIGSFLRTTRARGERCVLLIHGKGDHSPQGQGVLRGEMAAWLSQGPASEHVAAFVTAREQDGGEGAVYVMLRR